VNLHSPSLTVVGNVPPTLANICTFRGIAFNAAGNLFVVDPTLGEIFAFTPNAGVLRPMRLFLLPAYPVQTDWHLTAMEISGLAMALQVSVGSGK